MPNPRVFDPPLTFGSVLGHDQMNALDAAASASINGEMGTTCAPAAPIVIGGAGLQVTGPFSATNATIAEVTLGTVKGAPTLAPGVSVATNERGYPRVGHGPLHFDSAKWTWDYPDVGSYPGRLQQSASVSPVVPTDLLPFEIEVPDGGKLTTVYAFVHPASGHTLLPANRPQLIVYVYDAGTGTSSMFGAPAVHNTGAIPTYESRTLLTVSASPVTIDRSTQRVHAVLFGEGGAGFVAGLRWDAPIGTFTRTRIGEE